jgi:hypothetical protein
MSLYPELNLKTSKFLGQAISKPFDTQNSLICNDFLSGIRKNSEHQREFFDAIAADYHFDPLDVSGWQRLNQADIMKKKVRFVLFYLGNSCILGSRQNCELSWRFLSQNFGGYLS